MKNFDIDSFAMGLIFFGGGIFLAGGTLMRGNLATHLAKPVIVGGSALVVAGTLILGIELLFDSISGSKRKE